MTDPGAVETSASRLARLRELEQQATKGPWGWINVDAELGTFDCDALVGPRSSVLRALSCNDDSAVLTMNNPADATFIAEARNALPDLLEVCEAARAFDNFDADEFDLETEEGVRAYAKGFAQVRSALAAALENLERGAE